MSEQLELLIQKGIEAAHRDDLERAEAHFREALRWSPTNTDALFNLGVIHYVRRDLDSALDLVSQCIASDPARPKAHYQRGMVRHAKGDLSGALADFDTELQSHPDDVDAVLSRGATLSDLGNKSEALASYERAMHLAPRDPRPHFNRGLLRNESDPDGAILDFSEAIDRDPCKADAYMGRAFLLRAKGRKKAALADFQAFLQFDGPRLHGNADLVKGWIRELECEIGGTSSQTETPLSELIDILVRTGAKHDYVQFVNEFRRSMLGVIAEGVPKGTIGGSISTDRNPVGVGSTADAEGRSVVLAFADPPAFARRFGMQFNAEISGEKLLETVLINPDCYGIRVNSAKREVSVIIDRQTVQLLQRGGKTTAKARSPWWRFW